MSNDAHRSRQVITKTEAIASNGMVTAMQPLAAEAGVEILRAGGSAADAAVATALAIGVVEPFMSGLGACTYAVSYDASRRQTTCYDGSAVAPLAANEDTFELVDNDAKSLGLYGWRATIGDASETGYRSPTVPGALAALKCLHDAAGVLPWRDLFVPAIRLADEGWAVDEYFFAQSAASIARLKPFTATMRTYFLEDMTPWQPGPTPFRQPELAKTLRTVADGGAEAFYSGSLAKAIVEYLQEHDGLLTLEDFETYEARTLEPLVVPYRNCRVATLPANSGGPTVAFTLKLLEGFDLQGTQADSIERLHLLAEALRMSYSDRFRFLGDPGSVAVPIEGLLHERYVDERRARILRDGAPIEPYVDGDPWRFDSATPPIVTGSGDSPTQHTTHVNVVDKGRNMVALTATLGGRFGSGVTVPGGVVLNNGMMWYDPEPGHVSSIAPGKRALHAAAPSLLFNNDGPLAAIGSPGARRIMSAVVQVLLNLVDHDMGIQESIAYPRIHREAAPGVLLDSRFPDAIALGMKARGYNVTTAVESFMSAHFGRPTGILLDREASLLRGGVELYRTGTAIGY